MITARIPKPVQNPGSNNHIKRSFMKNVISNAKMFRILAFIALAAVIIFSMTAATCGGGKTSGEAAGGGSGEPGTLTITGLPKQELLAVVVSADKDLSSLVSVGVAALLPEAGGDNNAGGNVFKLYETFSGNSWTGTGKRQVILVNNNYNEKNPTDKNNPMFRTATVNFTKGGAKVKFSSFKVVTKEI
jgi:hypothetical protein